MNFKTKNKGKKMISIVCSNYNSDKWIDGYLQSLNAQYMRNFEVIFVDANSTDNSLEKIKNFKYRDGITERIMDYKERIGIYDAWNVGIKEARSEWVMNYNTDDRLLPNALSTYRDLTFRYPDTDLFYSSYVIVSDINYSNITKVFRPKKHSHAELLKNCYPGPFPLIKKEAVVEMGYFKPEYYISGDYEMWLNMSWHDKKFHPTPCILGYYFYNPEGMSSRPSRERFQEHLRQDTEMRQKYGKPRA